MQLKELAQKLGVKNIIVSHFNHNYLKNCITIIVNDNLAINLVGKTYTFVPLTEKGINKEIAKKSVLDTLRLIEKEMKEREGF